jgi:hypothetical protein
VTPDRGLESLRDRIAQAERRSRRSGRVEQEELDSLMRSYPTHVVGQLRISGGSYNLPLEHPGYYRLGLSAAHAGRMQHLGSRTFSFKGGETGEEKSIEINFNLTGGNLRVLIMDGEDRPLRHTTVLLQNGERTLRTRSDADGFVNLEGVPLGTYRLSERGEVLADPFRESRRRVTVAAGVWETAYIRLR